MEEEILGNLVVAWLKRQTGPLRVSLLGIFFVPARWIGHRLHGGVYVPGDLRLTATRTFFEPDRMRARFHRESLSWSVPLTDIEEVVHISGMLMETIEIRHGNGVETMKCARGGTAFVQALEAARAGATPASPRP